MPYTPFLAGSALVLSIVSLSLTAHVSQRLDAVAQADSALPALAERVAMLTGELHHLSAARATIALHSSGMRYSMVQARSPGVGPTAVMHKLGTSSVEGIEVLQRQLKSYLGIDDLRAERIAGLVHTLLVDSQTLLQGGGSATQLRTAESQRALETTARQILTASEQAKLRSFIPAGAAQPAAGSASTPASGAATTR